MFAKIFKKKKPLLNELLDNCEGLYFALATGCFLVGIFCLVLISYAFGRIAPQRLYDFFKVDRDFFNTAAVGFLFLTVIIVSSTITVSLCNFIRLGVLHIKAVINYCYLPFTTEEIKAGINKGLYSTLPELFEYINKRLLYRSWWNDIECIHITDKELYFLLKSCTEIWDCKGQSFIYCNTFHRYDVYSYEVQIAEIYDDSFLLKHGNSSYILRPNRETPYSEI